MLLVAFACNIDDADEYSKSELGATQNVYTVPKEKGSVDVKIYSNYKCQVQFIGDDVDWATLDSQTFTGDGTVKVNYEANDEFPRMAKLRIWSSDRADTVSIRQYGAKTPTLSFPSSSITVKGAGGQTLPRLNTNLDLKDITVGVIYTSDDEGNWIQKYNYSNGYLILESAANTTENPRNARITVSYLNGWGETVSSVLYLTQANKNEELGTLIDFDTARDMAGVAVARDVYIEGYVVSNPASLNAGECLQLTATSCDYNEPLKTAYIESLDGTRGFRVVCKTPADNIFEQYSRVQLLLKGATVREDYDTSIKSYYIDGITSNMVMTSVKGSASAIPVKEKYMADLNDNDIYTYVTLKDCEIPIRKGPLVPVNEGYTPQYSVNSVAKYPTLIRDIQGNSMYLMTNIKCPYRRDGSRLPYGSGKLKGIIVHETYTRFNYADTDDENTYGQIGRYQLRHQSRGDIFDNMSTTLASGFSGLAFEMSYGHIDNGRALPTIDGMSGYVASTSLDANAQLYGTGDWSYLSPCSTTDITSLTQTGTPCGFEVSTADGGPEYTITLNSDKKGFVNALKTNTVTGMMPAIATQYTWNYNDTTDGVDGSADGFLICFSTKNISTDHLSLQLAAINNAPDTPRRWKVEWSDGGKKTDTWSYIGSYSPTVAETWATRVIWNLSGPIYVNMNLPLTLLGKDVVYLRLIPSENAVSTCTNYYDPATKIVSGKNHSLSYIGIRYNK